jgi:hypothetical protein
MSAMATHGPAPRCFSNFEAAALAEYQLAASALHLLKDRLQHLGVGHDDDAWRDVVLNLAAAIGFPDDCDRCLDEHRELRPARAPFGVDADEGHLVAHYLCPADGCRWARTWAPVN